MKQVVLERVKSDEIEQMYEMQVRAFMPLYEKYHDDETSPAVEPIERLRAKAEMPRRFNFFIVNKGIKVGVISVCNKARENDDSVFFISPIYILPEYQNQGLGYEAIQEAFALFSEASCWKLDTILQEPGNCHLYEKCGFVRVGEEHIINKFLTIIDYEKRA